MNAKFIGLLSLMMSFFSLTKVNPPSKTAATLSAIGLPHAAFSPSIAYFINSFLENGFPNNSLIA